MFDPNDLVDYNIVKKEQEPEVEEMASWLASFFDDEYDTFSKQFSRRHDVCCRCILGYIYYTSFDSPYA